MDKYIFNEDTRLWYELIGDYYFPCLTIPADEKQPVGMWGQRYKRYLKEYRPALYDALLLSGKLNSHLTEVDRQAREMFFQLVDQMAERESVTEQLKADNQMDWVRRMNSIRARTEEIIYTELIYY